jgi:hypothetical protein
MQLSLFTSYTVPIRKFGWRQIVVYKKINVGMRTWPTTTGEEEINLRIFKLQ